MPPPGETAGLPERLPVLFDTDIGSDIDDAVALAYLLAEPRCELLGVTTVSGEPEVRARLASAVCRAAGRDDVPVHPGAGTPWLVPQRQPEAPQKTALRGRPHRDDFAPGTAVEFMRRVIRSRPGEVVLLAVGPLTNVATLLAADPGVAALVRRFVWMGGVYTGVLAGAPRLEWNASLDPHAAARALRDLPDPHLFGLDVTLRCVLNAGECRRRLRGGALDMVAQMAEVWFRTRPSITFHDPLAAVALFHPEVCRFRRGSVEVELASPWAPGMMHWREEPDGPVSVAMEVDPDAFFAHYFGVFPTQR